MRPEPITHFGEEYRRASNGQQAGTGAARDARPGREDGGPFFGQSKARASCPMRVEMAQLQAGKLRLSETVAIA